MGVLVLGELWFWVIISCDFRFVGFVRVLFTGGWIECVLIVFAGNLVVRFGLMLVSSEVSGRLDWCVIFVVWGCWFCVLLWCVALTGVGCVWWFVGFGCEVACSGWFYWFRAFTASGCGGALCSGLL